MVNLNQHLDPVILLPMLGVVPAQSSMPNAYVCPRCVRPHLIVIPDGAQGGYWFSCRGCKDNGDLLELASAIWGIRGEELLRRLSQAGLPVPVDAINVEAAERQHVLYAGRRHQVWQTWTSAKRQAAQRLPLPTWVTHAGLARYDVSRWATTFGSGVGWLPKATLQTELGRRHDVHSGLGKDPGLKLDEPESLVFAYRDLPDRVASFAIYDKAANSFKQRYVLPVHGARAEAGLWFVDGTAEAARRRGFLLATSDLTTALRWNGQCWSHSADPAGVVAWTHTMRGESWHAWRQFEGLPIVFWNPKPDAPTLRMAKRLGGLISTTLPTHRSLPGMMSELISNKRPWNEVVAWMLGEFREDEWPAWLAELNLDPVERDAVLDAAKPAARARLETPAIVASRTTRFRDWHVQALASGVFASKKEADLGELVSDGILCIDKALRYSLSGQTYYQGRLQYGGDELAFCLPADVLERDALGWMRTQLIESGKGYMQFDERWRKTFFSLSVRLHPPAAEPLADLVGWSEDAKQFVFPRFSITPDGQFRPRRWDAGQEPLPAASLRPVELSPSQFELATRPTYDSELFWAVFSAIMTELLSPALNKPACGLLAVGRGAEHVLPIVARSVGCQTHSPSRVEEWPKTTYPFLLESTGRMSREDWLRRVRERPQRILMTAIPEEAVGLGVTGQWRAVHADVPAACHDEAAELAGQFVPAYLSDVSPRLAELAASPLDGSRAVLEDLAAWVGRNCGDAEVVRRASRMVLPEERLFADWFWQFVRWAVWQNRLTATETPDGTFIDRVALANVLQSATGLPMEVSRISDLWRRLRLYKAETASDNPGWLLDTRRWRIKTQKAADEHKAAS